MFNPPGVFEDYCTHQCYLLLMFQSKAKYHNTSVLKEAFSSF